MRRTFKVPSWDLPEEHIDGIALEHRAKFGEDPAIGCSHATFYRILRRVRVPMHGGVKGGGAEPLYIDLVTIAGQSRVYVDKACTDNPDVESELSVEEPDARP